MDEVLGCLAKEIRLRRIENSERKKDKKLSS